MIFSGWIFPTRYKGHARRVQLSRPGQIGKSAWKPPSYNEEPFRNHVAILPVLPDFWFLFAKTIPYSPLAIIEAASAYPGNIDGIQNF
jgi:hypothetical protein